MYCTTSLKVMHEAVMGKRYYIRIMKSRTNMMVYLSISVWSCS